MPMVLVKKHMKAMAQTLRKVSAIIPASQSTKFLVASSMLLEVSKYCYSPFW